MKSLIGYRGEVKEYIDGRLVNEQLNAITQDFKNTIISALSGLTHGNITYNIGFTNPIFSTDNGRNTSGGSQIGGDGIAVEDGNYSSNSIFTMETDMTDLSNGNYIEFTGTMVASENRSIEALGLGRGLIEGDNVESSFTGAEDSSGGSISEGPHAIVDKSGSPLAIQENQLYEVVWKLTF